MTRSHRRWHAWIWLVLGPLIVFGFIVGLAARPSLRTESTPVPEPFDRKQADARPAEEAP